MFDLKLGFKCNNNCKHCVVADKRFCRDTSFDEIVAYLRKLPAESTVQITGGEPSIYKDILYKTLLFCKEKRLNTVIQSNATGFSNDSFVSKIYTLLDHVHVAIHSNDPEIHNNIVGDSTNSMWEKTIKGWQNLLEKGVYCTTQTVLSRYNIRTLYDTFAFIQRTHPGTRMSMTYPHLMGNAITNDEVSFKYSEYKEEISSTLKAFKNYIFTESIPYCYLHPYLPTMCLEEVMYNNIEVRTGLDLSSGNYIKNYTELYLQEHKKAPLCKECIYNDRCVGVFQEYILKYRNNLDLFPIKAPEDLVDFSEVLYNEKHC